MAIEGVGDRKIVSIEDLRARRRRAAAEASRCGAAARCSEGPESSPAQESPPTKSRHAPLPAHLKAELDALPDVRREKVIEAKLRISQGYYEREDVRREILRSLLASLLPSQGPPADGPEE